MEKELGIWGEEGRGKGKGKGDVVVEFPVDKDRPLARLSFTYDGCSIGAVSWDGQGVKIYQIRPQPPQLASSGSSSPHSHSHSTHIQSSHSHSPSSTSAEGRTGSAWQVYHLRRGRTGAVVDGLEWSRDGRWAALGTRKGTVHVFGVNPYGGRPDVKSHWEGRVRNVDATQSMPTEMGPLVRLRAGTTPAPSPIPTTGYAQHARTPLAFTFVESSTTLPPHLLPTHASSPPQNAGSSHSRSYSSSHHTTTDTGVSPPPPRSPVHRTTSNNNNGRPTNYQDVLMFDPVDASLALRRVVLEMRPREQGMGMGIIDKRVSMGMTSISLPGMGFAGALSSSPSSASGGGGGAFGAGYRALQQQHHSQLQQEVQMELGARESTVMTWSLGGWQAGDVRKILGAESMMGEDTGGDKEVKGGRADWLAQAELSTCSKSSRLLPRSIYLSHQFSFHTLGEDYHALIRRYQLDIGGTKIDVRREVQVSAYSAGSGGESFVEGFASPRDIRHHRTLSSSFDEPLASALTNELVHPHTSGVLPMLPNGTPGAQAFRNPIPIRTIGDGMSESLGRLRREINKVRSPRLRPRPDSVMSASVPLEFDEEDEDFVGPGVDRGVSMSMSMSMGVESERERDTLEVPVSSSSRETSRDAGDSGSGPTVSTPATSEDDWEREAVVEKAVVEDTWGGWSAQDKLAVEEVERFDNIDVLGLLDEEQAPVGVRPPAAPQVVAGEARRKGRARRRG
ncbi:hypothetical protein C0991_011821 [Blastosporella zonata]|nr:hypothetical protein C0991_011821 [Blastosporella zonata]